MIKLMISLLICASAALVAEVASTSGSKTTVAMDQCTCTCPSKTVLEASVPTVAKIAKTRKRRQAEDYEDYDMENNEDFMDNSSKKDEQGDTTIGSNNGGNERYQMGEGASDGNNNVISRGSYGHTGRKIGNVKAKGSIKFGG